MKDNCRHQMRLVSSFGGLHHYVCQECGLLIKIKGGPALAFLFLPEYDSDYWPECDPTVTPATVQVPVDILIAMIEDLCHAVKSWKEFGPANPPLVWVVDRGNLIYIADQLDRLIKRQE